MRLACGCPLQSSTVPVARKISGLSGHAVSLAARPAGVGTGSFLPGYSFAAALSCWDALSPGCFPVAVLSRCGVSPLKGGLYPRYCLKGRLAGRNGGLLPGRYCDGPERGREWNRCEKSPGIGIPGDWKEINAAFIVGRLVLRIYPASRKIPGSIPASSAAGAPDGPRPRIPPGGPECRARGLR